MYKILNCFIATVMNKRTVNIVSNNRWRLSFTLVLFVDYILDFNFILICYLSNVLCFPVVFLTL